VIGPAGRPPPTAQEQFDATVTRSSNTALRVLGALAIVAALAMSTVALLISAGRSDTRAATTPLAAVAAKPPVAAAAPQVTLSVSGENKKGPDGKLHDSFSKTNFAVKVGQPTHLRIDNTDDVTHSITSTATGVSINVRPGRHTYTLLATKAGRFEWVCVIPCDGPAHGWAMTHPGYMAGYITAS
jgi:heme/copper-type cytochrome/quinol oxidase subunit 2